MNHQALASFIWSVADLLRGDYKQSEYGRVILPLTVLRRLDCVLEPTKAAVLAEHKAKSALGVNPEPFLLRAAKAGFYNSDPLDLPKLMGDQDNIRANLSRYVEGFSPAVRDIFEQFDFHTQIDRLAKAGLLYLVTEKFNSPTLRDELMNAIIDAFEAHTSLSKQALDSQWVRDGLKNVLLGPAGLYDALRNKRIDGRSHA